MLKNTEDKINSLVSLSEVKTIVDRGLRETSIGFKLGIKKGIAPQMVNATLARMDHSLCSGLLSSVPRKITLSVVLLMEIKLDLFPGKLTATTDIAHDLGTDSLDRYELCYALEEAFGITLEDDTLELHQTLAEIILIVAKQLSLK